MVSNIPDQTIDEGQSFTAINLDTFVSDIDNGNDAITWAVNGHAGLIVTIANRFATIIMPDENWNGAETLTFTASDPGGLFDQTEAVFTVSAVNDAPVASDDVRATLQDQPLSFSADDLTVNDVDVENDPLTVTAVSNPTNGTVDLSGNTITFSPESGFVGQAGFDYTVSDGELTDTGHVMITVTFVNDPPIVLNDAFTLVIH